LSAVKRALFTTVLVGVVLGGVELFAWLLLRGLAPQPIGELLEAAALPEPALPEDAHRDPARRRLGWDNPSEVIHPYVGYVIVPPAEALRGEPSLLSLGFPAGGPFVRERDPDRLVVGVFGGSAAAYFAGAEGPRHVFERLQSLDVFRGRRLVVFTTAQGGFKQPQSLLTLAYLLSLGARFDVLILIDGFNEVVMAPVENVPLGAFPFFPRSWPLRVGDPSLVTETQSLVGEIAYLARRRSARAEWLGHSPLRHSHTALLLWLVQDRTLSAQLTARRMDLLSPRAEARLSYLASGPSWPGVGTDRLYGDLASLWREGSLQMRAICDAYGIRFYHFLQPNQYLAGSKPIGAEERAVAVRPGHPYAPAVARGYPLLREAGRELRAAGVRFHDLTQVFADVSEPLYVDDCCHLGPRGNQLLARAIASAILEDERDPAPGPPRAEAAAPAGTRAPQ
jgi:hypothetical protein